MGNLFDIIFIHPLMNMLLGIYKVLLMGGIPYALGFSIIFLTILIRLLLHPLTVSQLKMSQKMQALTPHLSKVKEKHGKDRAKLQEETMRLYKEHGVNPAAGCLPLLIQLPLFLALYSVFNNFFHLPAEKTIHEVNKIVYFDWLALKTVWDTSFFGLPLGKSPSELMTMIPLVMLIPVLTGVFQFVQSKMLFTQNPSDKKTEKKDDFASIFQTQSLYIFPAMIGFISYTSALGLSLYWNTFTVFGILQQYRVSGLGGLKDYLQKK